MFISSCIKVSDAMLMFDKSTERHRGVMANCLQVAYPCELIRLL